MYIPSSIEAEILMTDAPPPLFVWRHEGRFPTNSIVLTMQLHTYVLSPPWNEHMESHGFGSQIRAPPDLPMYAEVSRSTSSLDG